MKRPWLFWLRTVLIGLLLSVVTVAVVYWRHTVPLSECSEVYRQYRHQPGVRAAFIQQMPINDTLRLDMTLLEAEDSVSFVGLLRALKENEEFIRDLMTMRQIYKGADNGNNIRFSGDCLRGCPGCPADPDPTQNEVVSYFPIRMCVVVFHTHTEWELNTVLSLSYFDKVNIDQ